MDQTLILRCYLSKETVREKTIESVSMLIPRGRGGPQASNHTSLGFFFAYSKLTCLALGFVRNKGKLLVNSKDSDIVLKKPMVVVQPKVKIMC